MIKRSKTIGLVAVLVTAYSAVALSSTREPGPPAYAIDRYTVDGGGGDSGAGDLLLRGTIGQHDASVEESRGGAYSLSGGFWGGARSGHLFSDSFEEP